MPNDEWNEFQSLWDYRNCVEENEEFIIISSVSVESLLFPMDKAADKMNDTKSKKKQNEKEPEKVML